MHPFLNVAMLNKFLTDKTEESQLLQRENGVPPATTVEIETETDTLTAESVTDSLNEITDGSKRARRLFRIGVGGLAAWTLGGVVVFRGIDPLSPNLLPLLLLFFAVQFIWLPLQLWMCFRSAPKFDAGGIAGQGGVQAIIPLFAAAQVSFPKKHQRAIMSALTILLPQMKANDSHLLTPIARRRIHAWLGTKANTMFGYPCPDDLRIAALKALEQVGTSDDIEVVERLANIKARTPAQMRVKHAAIECLPMLREHCSDVASAQTLLRASNAEDSRPDTLLRAASGNPDTVTGELLRGARKP